MLDTKVKIESNCVIRDDECWTSEEPRPYERKTGEDFKKELEQKIKGE